MTYAPNDLMTVRSAILSASGLSGDAVGIVGDPAHKSSGGYHCGNDWLADIGKLDSDYSKRESDWDRPGTDAASAMDIGDDWSRGVGLRTFTLELVNACEAGHPGASCVREIIYTPDGKTVRRYDRLGIRTSGDSSHLWHTHISFFRDSEGTRAGAFLALVQQILNGQAITGDDMGIQDWATGQGDHSWSLTQGPANPKTDAVWLPDGIAGQQRDTAMGHTWHAAARAALAAERLEAKWAELLKARQSPVTLTEEAVKALSETLGPLIEAKIREVLREGTDG